MAGISSGAPSPTLSRTRTRTCHGAVSFGNCPAGIYTSRRFGDPRVTVDITAADGLQLIGKLSATQARALARALLSAAEAIDGAQRFVRGAA